MYVDWKKDEWMGSLAASALVKQTRFEGCYLSFVMQSTVVLQIR